MSDTSHDNGGPATEWFVVNARDARWGTQGTFGCGAGDGPCVILMTGARAEDEQLLYPVSELAARYGASVDEETPDPDRAYAPFGEPRLERPPSWERLPWS